MEKAITIASFARIKGVSPTAVHKAIASGRLVNSLVKLKQYKKPRLNPVLAAEEWEANTDHNKRHSGRDVREALPTEGAYQKPDVPAAPNAKTVIDNYKARLMKIKHDEVVGKLVDAEEIQAGWVKLVTETKTKLLAIPVKCKAAIPSLTAKEVEKINVLIREALEDISNEG